MRHRLAVATVAFQTSLRTSLRLATQAGANGVQFDLRNEVKQQEFGETATRQLLHYLDERNLKLASTSFQIRLPLASPDHADQRLHAIKGGMTFAATLQAKVISIHTGPIPAPEHPDYQQVLLPSLRELAAHANYVGVVPCLSSSAAPETLLKLITAVDTGPLGIDANLAGWTLQGQSLPRCLRELHNMIAHVQVRDAVRRDDGAGEETAIGQGQIDWRETFALLSEIDYQGWLTLNRTTGDDRPGDLARGIQYLRKLLPGL